MHRGRCSLPKHICNRDHPGFAVRNPLRQKVQLRPQRRPAESSSGKPFAVIDIPAPQPKSFPPLDKRPRVRPRLNKVWGAIDIGCQLPAPHRTPIHRDPLTSRWCKDHRIAKPGHSSEWVSLFSTPITQQCNLAIFEPRQGNQRHPPAALRKARRIHPAPHRR